MPIIGIVLTSINAKKHEEIDEAVKIGSNMNITNVKQQDLPALNTKGLSIEFEFMTKYMNKQGKDKAEIGMEGNVIFMGKESDDVMASWKKDKKVPDDLKFEVIRIVSDKCSKKAIMISDDLQLPPPPLLLTQKPQEETPKKEK